MIRSPAFVLLVALTAVFPPFAIAQTYSISTFAGGALPVNMPATSASLYGPQSALALDAVGNLYFVDGNTVLKMNATSGLLTLVAGNGTAGYSGDNGPAVSAQLHNPCGLAVDSVGNLYIAEFYNNDVRVVSGGIITTIAGTGMPGFAGDGGAATSALLNAPYGITLDSSGNLYIADYGNNRIRKVAGGIITTVAGNGAAGFSGDNGPATSAQLNGPRSLAIDATGNLYISDTGSNRIREVSAGVIGTVAGNGVQGFAGDSGPATGSQLNVPCGIAVDAASRLYIADYYNNRIREVSNGIITTVAGTGSQGFAGDGAFAVNAQLNNPFAVATDASGNVYVADYGNNRIRKITGTAINTVAGNGTSGYGGDYGSAVSAQLDAPEALAIDPSGNVYVADTRSNRVRRISGGVVNTVAGNGITGFSGDAGPAASAALNQPAGLALDSNGNVYIADTANNRVRKVSASGVITTVAGNGAAGFSGDGGPASSAQLNRPIGLSLDSSGNLYIADAANNRIRKVTGTTIATVAGVGTSGFSGDKGAATAAQLNNPSAVALDPTGSIYVADTGNNRVRKIASGTISTIAGNGIAGFSGDNASAAAAGLYAPGGLALNGAGTLYVADTLNNVIRKIASGTITTIAGGGPSFGDGGLATNGMLSAPQAIAIDPAGNLYVADTQDNRVRLLSPVPLAITGPVSLPAGTVATAYGPVTFVAAGGAGGYAWSVTGLPKGLTLSTAGILTGTPTMAGGSTPQFTVKDAAGATLNSSLAITISNPTPVISGTSPTSVVAYSTAFTLTVNGTGFLAGATVLWNSVPLVTKVVSGTQLTASVPANLIGGAGSVSVVVNSGGTVSGTYTFNVTAPPPVITGLSPSSVVANGPAFTLTVTGTGFTQAATIQWNGLALPTTYGSATQLTAYVSASLVSGGGGTASVIVGVGLVSSAPAAVTINAPPAISTLSPATVVAGTASFTLTVNGTGFAQGDTLQWNGAALATTFVGASQLTAAISASLLRNIGTVTILVSLGGSSSNGVALQINSPPAALSLNPQFATAGGTAFTLTVNGSGFASGATVTWSGTALTTTFVSSTQLAAAVTANQIVSAGSVGIAVSMAGASSAAIPFTVQPLPTITTLTPATVTGAGAPFVLTVNGTGFIGGATVQWGSTALTTTFLSATQLAAAVPANLAAGSGVINITVVNPGAPASLASKLTITATPPNVATHGVVPIYSAASTVQPGSWISIYGTALANGTYTWKGDFPTTLGGTSVTIDNKAAYLWSVSPTQINLQAPLDTTTGNVSVVVTTAAGKTTSSVTLAAYGPSFSLFPGSSYSAGVILTPNGSGSYGNGTYDLLGPANQFSFSTRPVKAGEVIELFGVGFGPTNPPVAAGKVYAGAAPTTNPVTVTIGGITAQVLFAGMVQSGVYQLNVIVPAAGSGDQPLLATVSGNSTPPNVRITLQ